MYLNGFHLYTSVTRGDIIENFLQGLHGYSWQTLKSPNKTQLSSLYHLNCPNFLTPFPIYSTLDLVSFIEKTHRRLIDSAQLVQLSNERGKKKNLIFCQIVNGRIFHTVSHGARWWTNHAASTRSQQIIKTLVTVVCVVQSCKSQNGFSINSRKGL